MNIVGQFHDDMFTRVLDNRQISRAFLVTNGVKQACVLAPMLFSMMFSAMLTNAFNEDEHGIKVNYHTDGKFFNFKRLQAKTKVEGVLVHDFLFADDCALIAASEAEMQEIMHQFSATCANFGLTISNKKTQVLRQPPSHHSYMESLVTTNEEVLNAVDKFTYLGSVLSRDASAAFGRL